MKLTKTKLKEIIAEELALEAEEEAAPEEGGPSEPTVVQIINLIEPKMKAVDKPKEYAELLKTILKHEHPSLDKALGLKLAFGSTIGNAIIKGLKGKK